MLHMRRLTVMIQSGCAILNYLPIMRNATVEKYMSLSPEVTTNSASAAILQLRHLRCTALAVFTNCRSHTRLLMLLAQQGTLVESLVAWWHV